MQVVVDKAKPTLGKVVATQGIRPLRLPKVKVKVTKRAEEKVNKMRVQRVKTKTEAKEVGSGGEDQMTMF